MYDLSLKVLIIEPLFRTQEKLSQILQKQNLEVKVVNNANDGIYQIFTFCFDIIICQQELPKCKGIQVFKKLENYLLNSGSAFFILNDKFEPEEFLIGTEMGIDGFIFTPLDENVILRKINRHLKRVKEKGVFDTIRFKNFFASSPIAKLISESFQIIDYNESFKKIFDVSSNENERYKLQDFFHLTGNQNNRLNIRKLENGLIDYCCCKRIRNKNNTKLFFDLHFYNVGNEKNGRILTEVIPVGAESIYQILNKIYPENYTSRFELESWNPPNEKDSKIELTKRERDIFEESAKGHPIKQIASILNLSERTVEKHRSNIMKKTNSHSILEAIMIIQCEKYYHNKAVF